MTRKKRLLWCVIGLLGVRLLGVGIASGLTPLAAQDDKAPDRNRARVLATPPKHAREFLSVYGLDESHLRQFVDGEKLGPSDEETLLKVLFRLESISPAELRGWVQPDFELDSILKSSEAHRADTVRWSGKAVGVTVSNLAPEVAERLGFEKYFVVRVEISQPEAIAVVCTRAIPQSWEKAANLSEPVTFSGLLLKRGEFAGEAPEVVFAANHVEWYPTEANAALGVTADHVVLASAGMDISTLDAVRGRNGRPFEATDTDCFYGLLSAVNKLAAEPRAAANASGSVSRELDLPKMLQRPDDFHAQKFSLQLGLRRATKVLINSPELRSQLGFEHYYQLDAFLPLDRIAITVKSKDPAVKGPTFTNAYPITLCVRELPAGIAEGDKLQTPIEVEAYFFRLWSFRSEFVAEANPEMRQTNPLFIAAQPRAVRIEPLTNWIANTLIGGILLATIVAIMVGFLRFGRSSKRNTLPATIELPPSESHAP